DLEAHRKNALATLNAGACSLSTAGAQYKAVAARVNGQLSATQGKINSTIQGKQAAAAQFATNSGVSVQNLDKLVSLPPRSSTITGATSRPEDSGTPVVNPHTSVYVGTVVETITTPAAPTITTTTSPVTTVATSNAVPAPIMLPPYVPPPEHKNINWVPILAVGIPAAILTALVLSKASKSRVSDAPPSSDGGGGGGGGGGSDPNPPQTNGTHNPPPSLVPGGGDLAAWHITLDSAFTDAEKGTIAAALQRIPACYRYKLQGIYVQSKVLPRTSDGCVAGLFMLPNGNTVYLSPSCAGVQVGITVHEFFHVIGSRNNNAVHNQWWPIRARYNNCPVTHYGETNQFEDFAEAGRLVEAPDTGMEARYSGACVDAKVDGLRQIMNHCPGQ
ncbi:MAG: M12 family metallopeptidase, partial [Bdellovibrionota bacterium]